MEPTLRDIDDYNGNESPKKRRTVLLIIVGLLLFGTIGDFIINTYFDEYPEIYMPQMEKTIK